MSSKRFRALCLVLLMMILPLSLVGCSDSKTLKKDQYQIYHHGNSFTVHVTDTDINAEDIETVKVKIRYKYAVAKHGDSIDHTDIRTRTKTETFEVKKFKGQSGNFSGSFHTADLVTEYKCKKVVAYYAEDYTSNGIEISILEAIGLSVGGMILGVILWFICGIWTDLESSLAIAAAPNVIFCLGMLVTGQWIQALIFFLGIGVLLVPLQIILQKLLG